MEPLSPLNWTETKLKNGRKLGEKEHQRNIKYVKCTAQELGTNSNKGY